MWNAQFVYETACKLADIALQEQSNLITEHKPDNSLVTQADKKVEDYATAAFSDPANNTYVIGEETVKEFSKSGLEAALSGNSYVIDPIDGTVPYAACIPVWGISIGYAEQGKVKEGCIVLPGTHEVIITNGNAVLYGKGAAGMPDFDQLEPISAKLRDNCTLPSRVFVLSQLAAKTKNMSSLKRGVSCYASAVFPFVYIALGRLSGLYTIMHAWDCAAGFAILSRLGFHLAFSDGSEVTLDLKQDFDFSKYQTGAVLLKDFLVVSPSKDFSEELLTHIK